MKAWRASSAVGDLGRHVYVTMCAWAGTLAQQVEDASFQVAAVGAFSMGSNACWV